MFTFMLFGNHNLKTVSTSIKPLTSNSFKNKFSQCINQVTSQKLCQTESTEPPSGDLSRNLVSTSTDSSASDLL